MRKSKALVHVKPAESEAPSVIRRSDEKLVDEACDHIRSLLQDTLFRGTAEVGSYVFETFFGGDPKEVGSKRSQKEVSFRALSSRCDTPALPVSKSWLQSAVSLAVREKSLAGNKAWDSLGTTHKVRLLSLHDDTKVLRLAERAHRQELSSRALHALVAKELEKQPRGPGGRPPKKAILRAVEGAMSAFSENGALLAFTKTDVKALETSEAKSVLQSTRRLIVKLQELVLKLAEHEQA